MKQLEDRIRRDGVVRGTNIQIGDRCLNHKVDQTLRSEMGNEFKRLFDGETIDRILTIEASGIAVATAAAMEFGCPLVFAKKSKTSNQSDDVSSADAFSFTHGWTNTIVVSKEYLHKGERVLLIDDFLATGSALRALRDIVLQAGAVPAGAGIVIEKAFQPGGDELRAEGLRIESLARIRSMSEADGIEFC